MLIYCPSTGLPLPESYVSQTPSYSGDAIFPDLLENQKAKIRLTASDGTSSVHQVNCSIVVKGDQKYPNLNRQEIVICPQSGEEIRLVRLLVIHDQPRARVVLRLPPSYRNRSYKVLSWWFEALSHSPRHLIPDYASKPELEFMSLGDAPAKADTESKQTPVASPKTPAPRSQKTPPPASKKTPPPVASPKGTKDLPASMFPALSTPSSAPNTPYETQRMPNVEDAPGDDLDSDLGESTLMDASIVPSKNPPPPISSDNLVAPVAPPMGNKKGRHIPKPTVGFGEHVLNNMPNVSEDKEAPTKLSPSPKATGKRNTSPIGAFADEHAGTVQRPVIDGKLPPQKTPPKAIPSSSVDDALGSMFSSDLPDISESFPAPSSPHKTTEMPTPDIPDDIDDFEDDDDEYSDDFEVIDVDDLPDVNEIPDMPTVARPAPEALALLRNEKKHHEHTAVREMKGDGISVSDEAATPNPYRGDIEDWKKSKTSYWFEADLSTQTAALAFQFPAESSRILDKGGSLRFHFQLHRLPTYPIIAALLIFENHEKEIQHVLQCPMDIDETKSLIFLDLLMQNFSLRIDLCDNAYNVYRDIQVQQPLEGNVEYIINEARTWKSTISSSLDFQDAIKKFEDPEYDRLGKMTHNFSQDTFHTLESPSMARLAAGIVSYWSSPEQFDYLVAVKSFPLSYFESIQKRVLQACLEFGIHVSDALLERAIQLGFGHSISELLRKLLSSFAEVNLQIKYTNDLDPWDNLENWQQLFNACDQHGIEVDAAIEELAEAAERRCHEESDIPVESVEEFEVFEDYQEMEPQDLLGLLHDTEHRLDAAIALAESGLTDYIEEVASIFPQLPKEEATAFTESFIRFGPEAESYLLSWLPLPQAYQREAAMLALGSFGSVKAIEPIIKRLRSGEEWEIAAEALGRIGPPVLSHLGREINNKNWLIRLRAVKALSKLNHPQARELIEKLSRDPNEVVKSEVTSILKQTS